MSVPGAGCAGLGGTIAWTDTSTAEQWQGRWTCRLCELWIYKNFTAAVAQIKTGTFEE